MRFALGSFYCAAGNMEKAREAFAQTDYKALSAPRREQYDIRMGYVAFAGGDYRKAYDYFDRIGSRSEYADHARYYKAYIDYAEGRYGRAKQAFTALLRSDAYRDVVPYYLMQIEFREGNYRYVVENGEMLARRAVPERRAELERVVAESWFRLEDFNRTLEHLAAFRKAGGEMDRDASYLEGFSLYRTARYAEAAEWLRKACGAEDALTQNASYHLADCYLRAGDKESAMQAFAMASDESLDATVAEDALFFLVLSTDTITLGPITLSAERNYAENVLMMVCAAMTCWFALRQLNIHSNTSPVVDDTLRYRQTAEDLLVYAKRHQLTAREQEVLDYILRERRVELYHEKSRFFSTRFYLEPTSPTELAKESQWNALPGSNDEKAQQYFAKYGAYPKTQHRICGMRPVEDPDGKISVGGKKYRMERFWKEDRVFLEKHYLFPIPTEELQRANIQQNPNW